MEQFKREIAEVLAEASGMESNALLSAFEYPPRREMGDLAFPCFPLAKAWKKSPKAIAEELAGKIRRPSFLAWARAEAGRR